MNFFHQGTDKAHIVVNSCLYVHRGEQHVFLNVNICWNTNISFHLETSGGKNSNLYLNVVNFFNTSVN
jgi:hypothetical protein